MASCATLVGLAEQFECQLTTLKHTLILRDQDDEHNCASAMKTIRVNLERLHGIIQLMRGDITRQRQCVDIIRKEFVSTAAALQDRVTHCQSNLPDRLPQIQPPPTQNTSPDPSVTQSSTQSDERNTEVTRSSSVSSVAAVKSKKEPPALRYLTVDEFESVPKYMRGRITYDQMNQTIDEFNNVLKEKHAVLHTPRSRQNDPIRQKIHAYKQQHTKDTKGTGIFFVVEADIKEFSNLKLDRIGASKLTILRHCRRIREIRGGGLTRYAVC